MWSWLRRFRAPATVRLVALAVAYLLVAQAVFTGLAAGAKAGALRLDRTLAISLCAPDEAASATAAEHGSPPLDEALCCAVGCTASGNAVPTAAPDFETTRHDLLSEPKLDSEDAWLARPVIRSPIHPRAPPVSHER